MGVRQSFDSISIAIRLSINNEPSVCQSVSLRDGDWKPLFEPYGGGRRNPNDQPKVRLGLTPASCYRCIWSRCICKQERIGLDRDWDVHLGFFIGQHDVSDGKYKRKRPRVESPEVISTFQDDQKRKLERNLLIRESLEVR